ncbi:MAG: TIGR00269 family protein [Thaumarchaeota archaeon]|nr:TIGR00269 family protein [Nitrososphaerota archaeon]
MGASACARCQGKAVYTRRYSGESLCASCFKDSIVEKTKRTISKYDMLNYGQRVGVAVSGGKDSLSLLQVLHGINRDKRFTLVALTVDEGVEGYREEAVDHAANLVRKLGVEHILVSYKQLYAIDEAAVRAGVDVIATAHNLDDYAQTFLMNLLHGDADRLAWLDPTILDDDFPLRRVKPFMEIYEEEIALYAYFSAIPFQSVSCPYMHEGLRSEVRDFLNEMEAKHAGMKNVLLRSSLLVASKLSSLEKGFGSIPCSICGKPSSKGTCNVCTMKKLVAEHSKSVLSPSRV